MRIRFPNIVALAALLAAAHSSASAEVRRALLVGIDQYSQPEARPNYQRSERTLERLTVLHGNPARRTIENLNGAFNDARAIKELLVQHFGFDESNIILLPNANQPATADNILSLLESHLISSARPGDTSFSSMPVMARASETQAAKTRTSAAWIPL